MRTDVILDDALVERAKALTGIKTTRAVIDEALRLLTQLREQTQVRDLRGQMPWEGDRAVLREARVGAYDVSSEGPAPHVVIEPQLYRRVEQAADEHKIGIDRILTDALRRYLWELDRRKISEESQIYQQRHAELKVQYLGQYVAMHNGQVVDHDKDVAALRQRLRLCFGRKPVMVTLVEEVAERPLIRRGFQLRYQGVRRSQNSTPAGMEVRMYDQTTVQRIRESVEEWEQTDVKKAQTRLPERHAPFTTISGAAVNRLYTPADVADLAYDGDLGLPGRYPFTRGIHPTGYRGKPWTMRMFSGFGTAEETNARFKYLLAQGQTGLSVAFDMPTLYGYDSDAPEALGEFGKCGVAISSLADMEVLLDGVALDQVTTSMTINSPAAIIWAMYIAAAEKRGFPRAALGGTTQNDILKEYIAQKEFLFPPAPSMRLVVDTIEFGTREMPKWNTISISGYHIREAGATAAQELAFTLADGFAYVEAALARGLAVDDFAPRLSFFFNVHNEFFEEVAKFRAARRIWARALREKYGARDPRSWMLRTHAQTSGVSLTAQQPEVNIIRVALQALAGVLGGTQSLHTNSMDEAHALPSARAATIALRTQQVIAEESGVASTIDPLAGSFYVEALTDRLEDEAHGYFRRIEALGGVIPALEMGFMQREIAEAAFRFQQEVDSGERTVVGVNGYVADETQAIPILAMDPQGYERQIARLRRVRAERDGAAVQASLRRLADAAHDGKTNLMYPILDAVNAYATLGEITGVFRQAFGEYQEPVFF